MKIHVSNILKFISIILCIHVNCYYYSPSVAIPVVLNLTFICVNTAGSFDDMLQDADLSKRAILLNILPVFFPIASGLFFYLIFFNQVGSPGYQGLQDQHKGGVQVSLNFHQLELSQNHEHKTDGRVPQVPHFGRSSGCLRAGRVTGGLFRSVKMHRGSA